MMVVKGLFVGDGMVSAGCGGWRLVVGRGRGWMWGRSGCYRPSATRYRGDPEHGEPCDILSGGEKVEVGVDLGSSTDPGAAGTSVEAL